MEKPGMDRRASLYRAGLLNGTTKNHGKTLVSLGFFLLAMVPCLRAQQAGDFYTDTGVIVDPLAYNTAEETAALGVELFYNPESPQVHTQWILAFLVDYPVPSEVTVRYPPLPEGLTLEQIRTRLHRAGSRPESEEPQTMVEFWFVPHRVGDLSLGAFEVITPGGSVLIEPSSRYVQGDALGRSTAYRPACSWDRPPGYLRIGEPVTLVLRMINWDPLKPLPPGALFLQNIPPGVILDIKPLTGTDQAHGRVLRIGVIPLEGTEFTLKSFRLQYEDLNLEIPELRIPIRSESTPQFQAPAVPHTSHFPADTEDPREPVPPFPEISPRVFPWFRAAYAQVLQTVQTLWNQGQIAEALGELRRNERESPAGPYLASLRREAEQRLGFSRTADEPWRPRALYGVLLAVSLGLFILTAAVGIRSRLIRLKRQTVTSGPSPGYKGIRLVMVLSLILVILVSFGYRDPGQGVLRAAQAYRVPDEGGMVSASFKEGQPVHIRSVADGWVYVESLDGSIGWVPRNKLIWY